MIPRLYIDASLAADAEVMLNGNQTHYLKDVLRRRSGDPVRIFNARDGEFDGEISALAKKFGAAKLVSQSRPPEPVSGPILFFAPVKRAPLEMIIQKGTELGVSAFAPILTERSVVSKINRERLGAIALEASEQCGRLSVPSVDEPIVFAQLFADWPNERCLMYCDEAGDDPKAEWGGVDGRAAPALAALSACNSNANEWGILIGPEGGFSPAERQALRARKRVLPVTLGPRILRADTATIAALAIFQASLGDWRADKTS